MEAVDEVGLALEVGQVQICDVQQRGLADHRVGLVGVQRDQRNFTQAVIAGLHQLIVRGAGRCIK